MNSGFLSFCSTDRSNVLSSFQRFVTSCSKVGRCGRVSIFLKNPFCSVAIFLVNGRSYGAESYSISGSGNRPTPLHAEKISSRRSYFQPFTDIGSIAEGPDAAFAAVVGVVAFGEASGATGLVTPSLPMWASPRSHPPPNAR